MAIRKPLTQEHFPWFTDVGFLWMGTISPIIYFFLEGCFGLISQRHWQILALCALISIVSSIISLRKEFQ